MRKRKPLNTNNKILIDIRENKDYLISHLPGTINIPYFDLISNYSNLLDKRLPYILICYNGYTSRKACKIIKKQGYKIKSIKGGYSKLY